MSTSTTLEKSRKRSDAIAVNVSLDREAVEILRQLAPPGTRGTGRLLGRLLYEHVARQEERQKFRQRLVSVIAEEEDKT